MMNQTERSRNCGLGCCGHEVPRVSVSRTSDEIGGFSRRSFLVGLGTVALSQWALQGSSARAASSSPLVSPSALRGKALVVKPVLVYSIPQRRPQTSWRSWGGIQTQPQADEERQRITAELAKMARSAEFPLKILPVSPVRGKADAEAARNEESDVMLVFAAGGGFDAVISPDRPTIVFVRHKSGPAYLWYEIIHPRFLRKTVDEYAPTGMDVHDVVVDDYNNILWRLRALYGLKNSFGERIVAIGDASGWGAGGQKAPQLTREKWHMEIIPVTYEDLGQRIKKARADSKLIAQAQADAKALIGQRGIKLETKPEFVTNAFVLTRIFKDLMAENQARAMTVNHCMGTIMPISETTACLPLSLLNDEGYMAFCESDFVVIPSGVLLHHISGLPVFLNDPTYPHDGIVTVAHCTAPRKLDGKHYERTRIMTHFESDYGAAPKVEMSKGEVITMIDPDFGEKRWLGFTGKTLETPFMDICRAQVDVTIEGNMKKLLEEMVGFHWMMSYGDYRKEIGYALKKAGIEWVDVSEKA
jgi:hypothetical protein